MHQWKSIQTWGRLSKHLQRNRNHIPWCSADMYSFTVLKKTQLLPESGWMCASVCGCVLVRWGLNGYLYVSLLYYVWNANKPLCKKEYNEWPCLICVHTCSWIKLVSLRYWWFFLHESSSHLLLLINVIMHF